MLFLFFLCNMEEFHPNSFYPVNRIKWRNWLKRNHHSQSSVWLIFYRKHSPKQGISLEAAVEEALCFGWIDSKANKRDQESFYVYFSRRNPKSKWSGINRQRVSELIQKGWMQEAGLRMVEVAKATGTWDALNDVENQVVPADLRNAFAGKKKAFRNFESFPRSAKTGILTWIQDAKTDVTRLRRIRETVEKAAQNIRANQPASGSVKTVRPSKKG